MLEIIFTALKFGSPFFLIAGFFWIMLILMKSVPEMNVIRKDWWDIAGKISYPRYPYY